MRYRLLRLVGVVAVALAAVSGCGAPPPPGPAATPAPESAAPEQQLPPAELAQQVINGAQPITTDNVNALAAYWAEQVKDADTGINDRGLRLLGNLLALSGAQAQDVMVDLLADPDARQEAKFFVASAIQSDLVPALVPRVAELAAPGGDTATRRFAAELLSHSSVDAAVEALRTLREDPEPVVHLAAELGLARAGDAEAREAVRTRYLADDTDAMVRERILFTLLQSPGPGDLPVLHAAVQDEAVSTQTRVQTVSALVALADPASRAVLETAHASTEDADFREVAEAAIAAFPSE